MPRQIILNGTVANDGTGDNLRVTANKINANFSELYGWLRVDANGNLELVAPGGDLILGDKTGNHINIPAKNSADPITIGDDNNPTIIIPANNTSPVRISNENNPVIIGDDNCSSLNLPKCGASEVAQLKNPNGPIKLGANGSPVIELPTPGSNSPLKITNPNGAIALGDPSAPAINVPSNAETPITIGKPAGPQISVPQNPANPTAPIAITNPAGAVNIGDPAAGAGVSVPPAGSSNPVKITSPAGGVELGNPASGAGIDIPAAGSNDPTKVTGSAGGAELGNPTSGAGVKVPPAGSNAPLSVTNPTGPVNIGNPASGPGITVPPSGSNSPINVGGAGSGGVTLGDPANPALEIGTPGAGAAGISLKTGRNPFEVLYTGSTGKLDSSQYIKVTADSADNEGKSLHLAASTYDTGFGNSLKQHVIYFTDPSLTGSIATAYPTKRVASIRWYDQGASEGMLFSPDFNYNDGMSPTRGMGLWRHPENGIINTKISLNADLDSPPLHGVSVGRGAISFFQDIPSYDIPERRAEAVKGLTYIVIPGIHTDDGTAHVGQISGNPYKNRESDAKGIPYWSLGHKSTTQLIENAPAGGIEKSERTPGNEVIVWTIQNRVGINNTNPLYALDVTGDVAFTKTLRVGDDENAGTSGQFLTSTGTTTAPAWKTLSAGTGVTVSDTPSGPAIGVDNTIATKTYADNAAAAAAAALVDSAPTTLDTLNELAAALGDDPNFATTVSSNLGTKVPNNRTITAGTGLTGGGSLTNDITISHADTSSAATLTASDRTYVTGLTFDTFGHVTAYTTGSETALSGVTVTDDPSSNTNLKLALTETTSGTRVTDLKMDSSDLFYNPSTGTLTTPNLLVSASGVDFTGANNALYFGSVENRVTLANYNVGGKLTFEVNGGAYTAHFNADGTYQFLNLYERAVGTAARPLAVGSDGIIGYGDPTADTLFDAGTLSGAISLNRNNGTIQKVTLNGNATSLAISNIGVAQSFTIIFTQDGSGSRTLTTSSAFKFASGFKTLSTAAGAVDMLNIFFDGSIYYCTLTTGYA